MWRFKQTFSWESLQVIDFHIRINRSDSDEINKIKTRVTIIKRFLLIIDVNTQRCNYHSCYTKFPRESWSMAPPLLYLCWKAYTERKVLLGQPDVSWMFFTLFFIIRTVAVSLFCKTSYCCNMSVLLFTYLRDAWTNERLFK